MADNTDEDPAPNLESNFEIVEIEAIIPGLARIVADHQAQPGQLDNGDWWREDGIALQCTSIAAPVQFEGAVDGYPAYFRERWGEWFLSIAHKGQDPVIDHMDGGHWFGQNTVAVSWMKHDLVKQVVRTCVLEWRASIERAGQG